MDEDDLFINDIDDNDDESIDFILQLIFLSQNKEQQADEIKPTIIDCKQKITDEVDESTPAVKKKLRCFICSKKTGLDYFTCKCSSNIFCSRHRYPFEHNCGIEYKKEFKTQLKKLNPIVIKEKLERI